MNAKARATRTIRRLHTAIRTISHALAAAVRGRRFRLLADLYRAIDAGTAVVIGYVKPDGTASVRTIRPAALDATQAGDLTVRGYDHLRGEDRTFRIDRITTWQPAA